MSISSFTPGFDIISNNAAAAPYDISRMWSFYGAINKQYINNPSAGLSEKDRQSLQKLATYVADRTSVADKYLETVKNVNKSVLALDPQSPTYKTDFKSLQDSLSFAANAAIEKQKNIYKNFAGNSASTKGMDPLGNLPQ
jgi:hypothetical protein